MADSKTTETSCRVPGGYHRYVDGVCVWCDADQGTGSNDNSWFAPAIKQAHRDGYQNAVDALREMADHLNTEEDADLVRMLATALESMRP